MDKMQLTAPCGLDCFNCQIFEGNIADELKKGLALKLGKPEEDIPCKGCRTEKGCKLFGQHGCSTYDCSIKHRVELCCHCSDFPCTKLQPCADGASTYPHNLKLFNLCLIKKVGLDQWSREAASHRARYFNGKFTVGQGPVTPEP